MATGGEELEDYSRVARALTTDVLRANLQPAHPDSLPVLNTQARLPYLTAEGGAIRPDDPLTRGELAQALYALLDADNKGASFANPFSDVTDPACASSGGVPHKLRHPDRLCRRHLPPLMRLSAGRPFAVALHRCQFAAPVGRYGSGDDFSDVPDGFWAKRYLNSAPVLAGCLATPTAPSAPPRPSPGPQATALNRVPGPGRLPHRRTGGDESLLRPPGGPLGLCQCAGGRRRTAGGAGGHCDAAGVRPAPGHRRRLLPSPRRRAGPSAAHRCAAPPTAAALGAPWDSPLTLEASGLFFFNDRQGLLLGTDARGTWQVLETDNGGRPGGIFILNALWDLDFPYGGLSPDEAFWKAVVSAQLQPAGTDAGLSERALCPL